MIEPTARTEAARTAIMFSGLSGNMKLSKKASRRMTGIWWCLSTTWIFLLSPAPPPHLNTSCASWSSPHNDWTVHHLRPRLGSSDWGGGGGGLLLTLLCSCCSGSTIFCLGLKPSGTTWRGGWTSLGFTVWKVKGSSSISGVFKLEELFSSSSNFCQISIVWGLAGADKAVVRWLEVTPPCPVIISWSEY